MPLEEQFPPGRGKTNSTGSTAHIENYGLLQAREKALVRKIDLFLLPAIFLMYLLSYIDRTNIGNAKIAGLQDDLHLSSGQYSMSLIVFFISYVIFEVPSKCAFDTSIPLSR